MSPFVPENLISRDGFGRPGPPLAVHSLHSRLNLVLTRGISPAFRDGVDLFIPSIAIGSVPSFSGHTTAYRWRSLPRVPRHRAGSPPDSSRNGCCALSGITMGQLLCASLFPIPPLLVHTVGMFDKERKLS